MRGTVKFFNAQKGWGFITDSESKDIFVHHTSIQMPGFRTLQENDIVDFDIGTGNNGREQAVNVAPILTMKMVKNALKKENLFLRINSNACNACNAKKYAVINKHNVVQSGKTDMTFLELAAYAGFDVSGLE